MFYYDKRSIDFASLILASVVFILMHFLVFQNYSVHEVKNTEKLINISGKLNLPNEEENLLKETNELWQLEIPKINLKANIAEGTDKDTMNKYIGHFTNTNKLKGNVGLAAHNRGYPVNYFERVKELEKLDVIIYYAYKYVHIYCIESVQIIEDTDWSFLEETPENKLTLITCVENKPNLRLCVQAKQIIGGIYEKESSFNNNNNNITYN